MRKKIQVIAALLLIASVALAAVTVQVYRRDRDRIKFLYAQGVNLHDIRDSLQRATDALQNMEIQGGNYVLTGRPASLEAYRIGLRDWQDESETLALLAAHDPAAATIRELSRTGNRLVDELAATVSLYDAGSHDAALDSLRKGPEIIDLERARAITVKIQGLDYSGLNRNDQLRLSDAVLSLRRQLLLSGGLFCLGFAGIASLIFQTWRDRTASRSAAAAN